MPESSTIGTIEEGCIQCLTYFGIFKYPLTASEIHAFNPYPASEYDIQDALRKLLSEGRIFQHQGYFMLEDDFEWVKERKKGNIQARQLLKKSGKYVSIISSFPFVKAIAISGALSKFYAGDKPDIDYFIITSRNRLWIARTFLHLFKKLTFITGHQHYFCMNYFIDMNALEIPNRNQYTAIETATILPVYNLELNRKFIEANRWFSEFLPNYPSKIHDDYLIHVGKRPVKSIAEFVINHLFPEKLNTFLMNLTDKKWRKKWSGHNYNESDYRRSFQTEIHISKNHPADNEKKIMQAFNEGTKA
jgi:hypothetical protein